jgi:hypothetical protein
MGQVPVVVFEVIPSERVDPTTIRRFQSLPAGIGA